MHGNPHLNSNTQRLYTSLKESALDLDVKTTTLNSKHSEISIRWHQRTDERMSEEHRNIGKRLSRRNTMENQGSP